MKIVWTFTAWLEYVGWQKEELQAVDKINGFIEDIRRDPIGKGMGKPERLRGVLQAGHRDVLRKSTGSSIA